MSARSIPPLLLVLTALAAETAADGDPFPAQTRGDMTAHIHIEAADKGPQPGAARERLTLTVAGGLGLEVEEPRLADAVNAWEASRTTFCALDGDRMTWTQIIDLRQVKPGAAPLPDVKVRFRDDRRADWEEVEWVNLLAMRDGPPPELLPPVPPWWGPWLPWAAAVAGAALLLASGWALTRRRTLAPKPPSPDQWALRELDRLAQTPQAAGETEAHFTQLSQVVRRYLADRFGLPALRQTTAEFLETVRRTGKLSAERQAQLRDILERCDLAKFARAAVSPEDCQATTALARAFVEQTAAIAAAKG